MTDKKNSRDKEIKEDLHFDTTLRPKSLSSFIGQTKAKRAFEILIQAAQKRQEPIEHTLIYGPPGLGKTSLAHILAQEMKVNIRITSGPALERTGDLASILTNLETGDILFIDEIHRLNKNIEESLYPAMEDFCLDIIIGKGPSARTLRMELPHFTIIGATTRVGLISSPLRDRFGVIHKLNFYNHQQLAQIITRNAKLINIKIDNQSALQIAKRARGTPRIANRLLRRIRDVAQINNTQQINDQIIQQAIKLLDIDERGLDHTDRQLLTIMAKNHHGGPVGLSTIAAAISEDPQTIEDVVEPYLLNIGFIARTPRGRQLTPQGYKHLGINPSTPSSKKSKV